MRGQNPDIELVRTEIYHFAEWFLGKHHNSSRGLVLPEQFAEYPRRMEQEPEINDGAALTASKTPSRYRFCIPVFSGNTAAVD